MKVEKIEGINCAALQEPELWFCEEVPSEIRNSSRVAPGRPHSTAMQFDVLERYLVNLIQRPSDEAILSIGSKT